MKEFYINEWKGFCIFAVYPSLKMAGKKEEKSYSGVFTCLNVLLSQINEGMDYFGKSYSCNFSEHLQASDAFILPKKQ